MGAFAEVDEAASFAVHGPEFGIIRLHRRCAESWAVVDMAGAIAQDAEGRLIMRLTKEQATATALRMSALPAAWTANASAAARSKAWVSRRAD